MQEKLIFADEKDKGSIGFQWVIGRADCESALGAPAPEPDS
jgi:hypothetical protein